MGDVIQFPADRPNDDLIRSAPAEVVDLTTRRRTVPATKVESYPLVTGGETTGGWPDAQITLITVTPA
jgi:hypothetical protein